jgi:carbon storage regulator
MLVLTRKLGQQIVINDVIVITIVNVEDHRVQIGIEAPRHIPIFRKEVIEKIKNENFNAVNQDVKSIKKMANRLKKWSGKLTHVL